jgi:hypothetical protein
MGNKETIEALSITMRQGFLFFAMEKYPWAMIFMARRLQSEYTPDRTLK